MPSATSVATSIAALLAGGALSQAAGQAPDSTTLRPTHVTLTVTNDPQLNGVYRSSGIATKCGLADYGYPHRTSSFAVEFPDDPSATPMEVSAVSFDADTLAAGTTRPSFYVSASLNTPRVGQPPALVVRAKEPQYDEPGTVRRVGARGTDSLTIVGTATRGTKVRLEMTIVCRPRP
ncbi:MAG: hypothetical protein ACREKB_01295 [Candidatus Rokuibacteriota bacterium]